VDSTANGKAVVVKTGQVADDATMIRKGWTVEYTCNDGYIAASGDHLRGCLLDGRMGGEPLRCIEGCPRGWVHLEAGSNDCFSVFTHENVTAKTAMGRCAELNSILAMPKTATARTQLGQLVNSSSSEQAFIGLNDIAAEGRFVWADGEPLKWRGSGRWAKGEPNDYYGQDCVVVKKDGLWYDTKCDHPLHFRYNYICQAPLQSAEELVNTCLIDAPPPNAIASLDLNVNPTASLGNVVEYSCVSGYVMTSGDPVRRCLANGKLSGEMITCDQGCPIGWAYLPENGNCYLFVDEAVHWDVARSRCQEFGATLSMPKTHSETMWVVSLNPRYSIWQWINLSDRVNEGQFVWGDDALLSDSGWSFWWTGQPNNYGNKDCVFIREGGKWMDGKCDKVSRRFTCQKPKV